MISSSSSSSSSSSKSKKSNLSSCLSFNSSENSLLRISSKMDCLSFDDPFDVFSTTKSSSSVLGVYEGLLSIELSLSSLFVFRFDLSVM